LAKVGSRHNILNIWESRSHFCEKKVVVPQKQSKESHRVTTNWHKLHGPRPPPPPTNFLGRNVLFELLLLVWLPSIPLQVQFVIGGMGSVLRTPLLKRSDSSMQKCAKTDWRVLWSFLLHELCTSCLLYWQFANCANSTNWLFLEPRPNFYF